MNLDGHDLDIIKRACRLVRVPPGMDRVDLEQEVALRLIDMDLTVPSTDGLLWFLARQRARSVVRMEPEAPDALGREPPDQERADPMEWSDALALLSWRERTALDLRYRLDLTLDEIADAMHMSRDRARWILEKAERRYVMAKKKKGSKKGGRPC